MGDLPRASVYFPIVGAAVGLAGGLVYAAGAYVWSAALAVVVSTAFTIWMTGAFHEDALSDAFDGFGGGWNPSHVLAIMKDSRVGSYALVGVVFALAAKLTALTTIAAAPSGLLPSALAITRSLIAGHVLGRWSSVPLIARYPYVRPEVAGERPGTGRPFVDGVSRAYVVAATIIAFLIVILALGKRALLVMPIALFGTLCAGRYCSKRLGGITGDALGAANQLIELAIYLTLAARHA